MIDVNNPGLDGSVVRETEDTAKREVEEAFDKGTVQTQLQWTVDVSLFRSMRAVRTLISEYGQGDMGRFDSLCCLRSEFYNTQPKSFTFQ